jgi:hypothetical protein
LTETIEYDLETGLPVLPEGLFWRVGERDFQHYWRRVDRINKKPIMKPAVMIMKESGVVTRERKVPIYGKQWWNKHQVVEEKIEYHQEMGGPVEVMYQEFDDLTTQNKDDIPEFAESYATLSRDGVDYEWYYNVPMSREGIAFLAGSLLKLYREQEKVINARQEIERARLEAKEKFYGDYPPKTLIN